MSLEKVVVSVSPALQFDPQDPQSAAFIQLTNPLVKRAVAIDLERKLCQVFHDGLWALWFQLPFYVETGESPTAQNALDYMQHLLKVPPARALAVVDSDPSSFDVVLPTSTAADTCRYSLITGEHRTSYTYGLELLGKSTGTRTPYWVSATIGGFTYRARVSLAFTWAFPIADAEIRERVELASASGFHHG